MLVKKDPVANVLGYYCVVKLILFIYLNVRKSPKQRDKLHVLWTMVKQIMLFISSQSLRFWVLIQANIYLIINHLFWKPRNQHFNDWVAKKDTKRSSNTLLCLESSDVTLSSGGNLKNLYLSNLPNILEIDVKVLSW